ncbi:MAG: (2Fe-2S) ferredoxin domain-containing protein [Firmicutes bacterium]|nr:(2Fe-2S) ferredoxin domain-containing protein [Bacillota bacterium]
MKSLEELERIKKEAQAMTKLREDRESTKIVVGMGTCGIAAGARETLAAIMDELAKRNLQDVIITQTGCVGLCEQEPIVDIMKPGKPKVTYGRVTGERARQIIASHVVNDRVVGEWVIATG